MPTPDEPRNDGFDCSVAEAVLVYLCLYVPVSEIALGIAQYNRLVCAQFRQMLLLH